MRLLFGPLAQCRYTPTCSAYALEAVTTHGAWAGSWLALKRLGRCHPWGGCGGDPVPKRATVALPVSPVPLGRADVPANLKPRI